MQKTRPDTNYHGSNPFKTQTMRIQPQLLLLLLLLIPKTKNKNKNQESAESKCQKTPRFSSRLGVQRGGTGEKGDAGRETKPNIRSRIQPDKAKMGPACNWGNLLLRIWRLGRRRDIIHVAWGPWLRSLNYRRRRRRRRICDEGQKTKGRLLLRCLIWISSDPPPTRTTHHLPISSNPPHSLTCCL